MIMFVVLPSPAPFYPDRFGIDRPISPRLEVRSAPALRGVTGKCINRLALTVEMTCIDER